MYIISELDSRKINYLKGIAILAVMVGHFINRYLRDDWFAYAPRFANHFVILFFIIAGHVTYVSLSKRLQHVNTSSAWLTIYATFYKKKFWRLFPLYWIALILAVLYIDTVPTLPIIFMLDSSKGFWFLVALLHCYLFAPILFIAVKRISKYAIYILIPVAVLGLHYVYAQYSGVIIQLPLVDGLLHPPQYRGVFFGYLIPFGLGMSVPVMLQRRKGYKQVSQWVYYIPFFLFIALTNVLNDGTLSGQLINVILLVISPLLYVGYLMTDKVKMPFVTYISQLGAYSYSLFLFHTFHQLFLSNIGLMDIHYTFSIIVFIATFPLFFYLVRLFEDTYHKVVSTYIA